MHPRQHRAALEALAHREGQLGHAAVDGGAQRALQLHAFDDQQRITLAHRLAGRTERVQSVGDGDQVGVHWRGRAFALERLDPTRSAGAAGAEAAGSVHAPMPGVVVSLLVEAGQAVREGDALLVIESMKLQSTLCAAIDGSVAELPFAVGQSFQRGVVLARVHPAETTT